jgi:hypothetical protein
MGLRLYCLPLVSYVLAAYAVSPGRSASHGFYTAMKSGCHLALNYGMSQRKIRRKLPIIHSLHPVHEHQHFHHCIHHHHHHHQARAADPATPSFPPYTATEAHPLSPNGAYSDVKAYADCTTLRYAAQKDSLDQLRHTVETCRRRGSLWEDFKGY